MTQIWHLGGREICVRFNWVELATHLALWQNQLHFYLLTHYQDCKRAQHFSGSIERHVCGIRWGTRRRSRFVTDFSPYGATSSLSSSSLCIQLNKIEIFADAIYFKRHPTARRGGVHVTVSCWFWLTGRVVCAMIDLLNIITFNAPISDTWWITTSSTNHLLTLPYGRWRRFCFNDFGDINFLVGGAARSWNFYDLEC